MSGRKVCIVDGYTDEPALLGVPPYIAPSPRYIAGAVASAADDGGYEHSSSYITIDAIRDDPSLQRHIAGAPFVVIIAGAVVPGKYQRGAPISKRECLTLLERFAAERTVILGGKSYWYHWRSDTRFSEYDFVPIRLDVDAAVYDILSGAGINDRYRTPSEWDRWSTHRAGAQLVEKHPDFPWPLIAELESRRGCVRWFTGGCSFCQEPAFGPPQFRDAATVRREVEQLAATGLSHFRLGGQTCIYSYCANGIGDTPTPTPNPSALGELFCAIRRAAPALEVLHVDNANPAVIAAHPEESRIATQIIVDHTTSGNVLAFGLESADPIVQRENNLNATPEATHAAVALVNDIGKRRGANGLPALLPGLNFVCGLDGETDATFDANLAFLHRLYDDCLLLRRINIRQAILPPGTQSASTASRSAFIRFKREVRENIDQPMLARVVPIGTKLTDVYFESRDGKNSFGRQIGSYPILVGVRYPVPLDRFSDVVVTEHGQRSVTGVVTPFTINTVSMRALQALPGIGKRRAARLVRARPLKSLAALERALDIERIEALGAENAAVIRRSASFDS